MPGQATTPSAEKPDRSPPSQNPYLQFQLAMKTISGFSLQHELLRPVSSSRATNEVRGLTITDPRGFWNLAKKRP
jgi:hypothetical protein